MQGARTLAERLEQRDRSRFVGRAGELALLEGCLEPDPQANVILVSGPGGIGKSTLLREFGRRAAAKGWDVYTIEGRDLTPTPDALEELLRDAAGSEQALVLIDTFEKMGGLAGYLRRELLPALPDSTLIVIAGRGEPDAAWFADGWEGIAAELPLAGLAPNEALCLLATSGAGDGRAQAIVEWAQGSPLALALAADAAAEDASWTPEQGMERPELLRPLIRRLVETELDEVRQSALMVASVARVTTPELLRDVLPSADADAAYERLRSLTFTEPLSDGLTLHELVRKALNADFRRRDPERERMLRRQIVDHLYERAINGEPLLIIDIAHLVENPVIRWGFGWDGAPAHRVDDIRPGDIESACEQMAKRGQAALWPMAERFFREAPERAAVIRDTEDRVCAYLVCMTQANAPACAEDDPLIGPWLRQARIDSALGDSVLWHDSIDFTEDQQARVKAMIGMAGVLRSGSPNPRFAYLPVNPDIPMAIAFAKTLGGEHLEHLDFALGPHRVQCHRLDYGSGGLLAAARAVVYSELGLAAPDPTPGSLVDREAIRDALRNFHLPHELARSALARGTTPGERCEFVRALIRNAAEHAFGDTHNERLLQRVLTHGYIEHVGSHEQAALDLSLSRAAYFRRLRVAAERVADHISRPA